MDVDDPTSSRDETDRAASPRTKRTRSFRLSTVVASVPSIGNELRSVAVKHVETFGRASTGTPIRLLNGAAKDYATRAQFGNGAKSMGRFHFGMAGGDAMLVALGYLPLAGALALDVAAVVLEERRRAGRALGNDLSTEETSRLS